MSSSHAESKQMAFWLGHLFLKWFGDTNKTFGMQFQFAARSFRHFPRIISTRSITSRLNLVSKEFLVLKPLQKYTVSLFLIINSIRWLLMDRLVIPAIIIATIFSSSLISNTMFFYTIIKLYFLAIRWKRYCFFFVSHHKRKLYFTATRKWTKKSDMDGFGVSQSIKYIFHSLQKQPQHYMQTRLLKRILGTVRSQTVNMHLVALSLFIHTVLSKSIDSLRRFPTALPSSNILLMSPRLWLLDCYSHRQPDLYAFYTAFIDQSLHAHAYYAQYHI